jgi:hypothetical protein
MASTSGSPSGSPAPSPPASPTAGAGPTSPTSAGPEDYAEDELGAEEGTGAEDESGAEEGTGAEDEAGAQDGAEGDQDDAIDDSADEQDGGPEGSTDENDAIDDSAGDQSGVADSVVDGTAMEPSDEDTQGSETQPNVGDSLMASLGQETNEAEPSAPSSPTSGSSDAAPTSPTSSVSKLGGSLLNTSAGNALEHMNDPSASLNPGLNPNNINQNQDYWYDAPSGGVVTAASLMNPKKVYETPAEHERQSMIQMD